MKRAVRLVPWWFWWVLLAAALLGDRCGAAKAAECAVKTDEYGWRYYDQAGCAPPPADAGAERRSILLWSDPAPAY